MAEKRKTVDAMLNEQKVQLLKKVRTPQWSLRKLIRRLNKNR